MNRQSLLYFFLFLMPLFSETINQQYLDCKPVPFSCGDLHTNITYPFREGNRPDYCGYPGFDLSCIDNNTPIIHISGEGYQVKYINYTGQVLSIVQPDFLGQSCPQPFPNTTIDYSSFDYNDLDLNLTLHLNCTTLSSLPSLFNIKCFPGDSKHYSYYMLHNGTMMFLPELVGKCSLIATIPVLLLAADMFVQGIHSFVDILQKGFDVIWNVGEGWCKQCVDSGGFCGFNTTNPDEETCFCPNVTTTLGTCVTSLSGDKIGKKNSKKIVIGVAAGGAVLLAACCLFLFLYRHQKSKQHSPSLLLLPTNSSEPSPKKDPELGSACYQTHTFSYKELEEATDGFDTAKELGDGGFGTVYKGELRDGRTVAVKRLYENNCKHVEQFMNEIVILSRLHHQNLVTLYGCSSRHCRELLLVYEFVPNGTVADHLHGSRVAEGALTWPIRMNIAIETAEALTYLHAIEPQIIHRDVKTNNILLDNNFHVKVADFGLSRLFPVNATHVSTAPQGTPGYVDPEYHQCYQLTDKSDVYSFGVVLVELISSKLAVDVNRHPSEINLANMAINKIQNRELDQLIDLGLRYELDWEVKSMTTQVAELAFRCLQWDRDMRPPIKEVLEVLRAIRSGRHKTEKAAESDASTRNDTPLLKDALPYSPDSVADNWVSTSTTSNTSS